MPVFLIERKDRSISGDAIWAKDREEARKFMSQDEVEVHEQSDILAEMMKIEPQAGRQKEAFFRFVITPRSLMGEDRPHRP